MIQEKIKSAIKKAVETLWGVNILEVHLEHPPNPNFGDLTTNVALTSARVLKQSPMEIAKRLVAEIRPKLPFLEKIEVAAPGFVNFTLKSEVFLSELQTITEAGEGYGASVIGKGKRILLEHTSPNTNKALHLGHVKNNVLGLAIGRLLEFLGFKVVLGCLYNDRGIHISKAMWGYLRQGGRDQKSKIKNQKWKAALDHWYKYQNEWLTPEEAGRKGDHFVEEFYVAGVRAETEIKGAREEMQEMLLAWEAGEDKVRALWRKLNSWVYEGFAETLKRLGSRHDVNWYESELYREGKKMVLEAVEKGIFRRLADGAVLTNLKKFGLPETIIIRADGTTMYHTQDLYLTKLKREQYPSELYLWDVGPEQELYLKQLFALCEQLGIGKRGDYDHLSYGFVSLKGGGKMSSRAGTVVRADEVMDLMHKKAGQVLQDSQGGVACGREEKEAIAEAVGVGALKYGLLKKARLTETHFDPEESLSFEGNSGPYLQYTYARAYSVLSKARQQKRCDRIRFVDTDPDLAIDFTPEAVQVLRALCRFPETVREAGKAYAPNLLCEYLFDLAQKFNLFYEKCPIIKAKGKSLKRFRLVLTAATAVILKNGLSLLGIRALTRM